MAIRNLMFDFGGVFIDVFYERTRQAFINLGVVDFDRFYQQAYSHPLFESLETGAITETQFYQEFRNETKIHASDQDLRAAWNAILGDYRMGAVHYLQGLKNYRLFLFSNTNYIHWNAFSQQFLAHYGYAFDTLFEAAHYSHELGLRKPYPKSYSALISLHGLIPEETLFIDDTVKNLEGARMAGLKTMLLKPGQLLEEELPNFLSNPIAAQM